MLAAQPPPRPGQSDEAETRLTAATVLSAVPEELREVAIYYYVDQMNHDEIAAMLGTSRRTVGNRLEEFRAAAKRVLTPAWRGAEAGDRP